MNSSALTALGWGKTPEPPYHMAIFTSQRTDANDGFDEMVEHMAETVRQQPGFLGMDSAEGTDGIGIVVASWKERRMPTIERCEVRYVVLKQVNRRKSAKKRDVSRTG